MEPEQNIFHELEIKTLKFVSLHNVSTASDEELAQALGLPIDSIYRITAWLQQKGFCTASKNVVNYLSINKFESVETLPEIRLLRLLESNNNRINIDDIKVDEIKVYGIQWSIKNNWISITNKMITLKEKISWKSNKFYHNLELYKGKTLTYEEALDIFGKSNVEVILKRQFGRMIKKSNNVYSFDINKINKILDYLDQTGNETIDEYSYEVLANKTWINKNFRKYRLTKETEFSYAARRHIISRFANRIRQIFLALGFQEMKGDIIELSLWNFDALFQPQDHPARDLADTFYFKEIGNLNNEIDNQTLNKIKETHEKGWKDEWKIEEASKYILRTHDTCVSARTLYKLGKLPKNKRFGKFFQIEKVFRNEATDFKHLAEFYQVGGIIVSEDNNLAKLFGILSQFYKLLGFEQIRFRPSYFPYTEPSLEIEVYMTEKKQWIELGGAGVFRPEVSLPLCDVYPVIAWGLSLERPLMLMNELNDIRIFYNNDLNFLTEKKQKLKI